VKSVIASTKFHIALGLGVSAVILYWLVIAVDWKEVLDVLAGTRLLLLVPMTFVSALTCILRATRWRYLLRDSEDDSFMKLFDSMMLGMFATYLLPLRAGEVVRPYALSRSTDHSFPEGLSSVVIERFFDLSAVLLPFGLMMAFIENVPPIGRMGAFALSVVALAILAFILIGSLAPDQAQRICSVLFRPLPSKVSALANAFLEQFLEGNKVLRSKSNLIRVITSTAIIWLFTFFYFQLCFHAVGIPGTLWMGLSTGLHRFVLVVRPEQGGRGGVLDRRPHQSIPDRRGLWFRRAAQVRNQLQEPDRNQRARRIGCAGPPRPGAASSGNAPRDRR
jgi:uncharacterized protein (TIRG00374 family)